MSVRSLVLALLVTAAPAAAQELTTPAVPAPAAAAPQSETPPAPGPTREGARAGVATAPMHAARAAQQGERERAPRNRPGFGQPEALMIVGGAAVVIGLIVGDDAGGILAFGGAVTGLVGLYQYLR
ncbi:hypothetical protein [Roseisolibacter agri]|uniref:Uncharacterized protein n=1 Tax=Roseisolibacter agri TaxID=2014610 RepID=A0AA37QCS2_9BACT|nr:hypothetical protein [Roseisolibacter agri]GLC24348.1 hypothetical protein rosag_08610 [Roseisolibacter agri]